MTEQIWIAIITAIISPTLLFVFQQINNRKKGLWKILKKLQLQQLRLEIMFNLKHRHFEKDTILGLYDQYRALGGNSYIHDEIERWKNELHLADTEKAKK